MIRNRTIFLALFITASSLTAADWTEFRGPTGQGHATAKGLPLKWGAQENVVWKTALQGEGWSSPVIADGRVYVTAAVPDGGALSLRAVALDQAGGKILWEQEVLRGAEAAKHKKNSHASPTPIIEGNRLYVHFGPNGTACLDTAGKILWKQTSLPYPPVHGNGGSPALVDDKLIFSCDGSKDPFIVALNKHTGAVMWQTPRRSTAQRKFSFSTPLLIEHQGRRQLISPGSGVVYSLNPDNGKVLWEVFYGEGYSVVPRPLYGHGLVYVATGFNKADVLAIRPDGNGNVTDTHVAWKMSRGTPKTPSLLLVGGELYMVADNGIATCMDARTGEELWSERIGGNYSASPVHADGRIYFQSEEGKTVVIQPGRTFKVLAESELGEKTLASYAVADRAIYLRSEAALYRLEQRK